MSGPAIDVDIAPSWGSALRGVAYRGLFTGYRGYWLIRLALAVLLGWAGNASVGRLVAVMTGFGELGIACAFVIVPLGWFLYPLVRARDEGARALTILDEGVTVVANHSSLSVAWSAVRAVRQTPWDLVIVLDGATISAPMAALEPGTADSVRDRFRRAHEAPPDVRARARIPVPYRTAETRPPSPEDEEATPQEWRAPSQYRHAVLAFPTRGQSALGLLSLKRKAMLAPAAFLALGGVIYLLGIKGGAFDYEPVLHGFRVVGAVIAAIALGLLGVELSPALLALSSRSVRERSQGTLYAVGALGLYVRTHSFERRESWDGISAVRVSRKRLAIWSESLVDVIPLAAFTDPHDRETFVNLIKSEIAARFPRPEP